MNFSLFKLKSNKEGFSLIEVIVSITVFLMAMIGVIALISLNITHAALLRNRLIAANLAQEGIEVVRNIRDNNFLAQEVASTTPWDLNLNYGNNWRVEYNSLVLFGSGGNPPLNFHPSSGLYDYNNNPGDTAASIFSRLINIQQINANEIRITSTVNWSERGRNFAVAVEDHLFNWK
ncbi:MAG: prepilin-type N-terminal cleavage/methylation domain-containing protein [bacterium]|nr:prepilin-type N-terminal cleavage/methylation domain-containing protein [bacterium]